MLRRRIALSLFAFLLLVNARQRAVRHPELLPSQPQRDAFSFANVNDVTTRHLALDLTVDFESHRLAGKATLTIENLTGTKQLILDSYGLDVQAVTLDGSTPTLWSLGTSKDYGQPLTIAIQPTTHTVTITYVTMQDAPGLLWNTAEQSFGRKEPYLYSQNEPIAARSWIPIQDTPSMRMTWEATLRVPPQLLALMSAENNPTSVNPAGIHTFSMSKTMPSYLIAIAVGRLQFHAFDERTGVYAEPELMSDAILELSYLPDMVDAAERVITTYPFVRYDVLLMPPTYIVGGMEHPMLNFINPFSVVTGNHPQKPDPRNLIAHELSHSWSGDLVTLSTWNDIWLNEGITSYLALRIIEEMSGADRAELTYFLDRSSYAGYASQPINRPSTVMHRELAWPNDGFGATGYLKGELFLRTLEDLLGRPTLDAFLDDYFARFAFHWTDDASFLATLAPYVPANADLRLQEWLYQPGLPSNVTAATSSVIYTRVLQRAQAFSTGTPIAQLAPSIWTDTEIDLFLQLAASQPLRSRMAEIDASLHLSARTAPPLTWLIHGANASYAPAMPGIERILLRGGTNGAIQQLYNALRFTPQNRAFAMDVFAQARKRYDPAVENYVAQLLATFTSAGQAAA
ncbi:MAG TPA: M1 family aminopeptidase/hydrolase [Thermoanaerobaculia bacterium]|nr:M1 family aminopeptidase/hydrolase [Thermoanaerobaculia bacterium]